MTLTLSGKDIFGNEDLSAAYRERIQRFGFSAECMYYRSNDQHVQKLAAVAKAISGIPTECKSSILDVGCGYGALLGVVDIEPGSYLGIDIVPEFVIEASKNYPGYSFAEKDAFSTDLKQADTCLLGGVLSSAVEPEKLLRRVLGLARHRVIFDISVAERFPRNFADLNKTTLPRIVCILSESGFLVESAIDSGATWVMLVGRPAV